MNFTSSHKFNRQPLSVVDDIPVFSIDDIYVDNYRRIAVDHLNAMNPESDNPFIENELWVELEQSTRDLIEEYVPAGACVLDVGVGLGRIMGPLGQYRCFGIDITMEYLRLARERSIEVAFARVEDMPYQDSMFDAVVSSDVLEHVTEFDLSVKQILRVLKPGGHLIIRVPYREDLKVYLQEGLPYEFIHLRNFDENSIQLYFEKIHRCKLLQTRLVASYWQGETRLRYRMTPPDVPLRALLNEGKLTAIGLDKEGERILRSLISVPEIEMVAWINRIKADNPTLFKAVQGLLIFEIEMNVVLRKQP